MPRGRRDRGLGDEGRSRLDRVRVGRGGTRARDLRDRFEVRLFHPAGARHVDPATRSAFCDLVEEEPLGQLPDERARGRGAQVLLRRARHREVVARARRRAHRRCEDPAFQHHALPVALRLAAYEHGPARQARQALSTRLLGEPGPVRGDAVACLGGERQGYDEPQHNWKGAEGPARLHPLQYGKEAWAAHPGLLPNLALAKGPWPVILAHRAYLSPAASASLFPFLSASLRSPPRWSVRRDVATSITSTIIRSGPARRRHTIRRSSMS